MPILSKSLRISRRTIIAATAALLLAGGGAVAYAATIPNPDPCDGSYRGSFNGERNYLDCRIDRIERDLGKTVPNPDPCDSKYQASYRGLRDYADCRYDRIELAIPTTSPPPPTTTTTTTTSSTTTTPSNCPTSLRDPALWPYASTSPWNTPIGANAVYADPGSAGWPFSGGNLNTTSYSQPIYIATDTDPIRKVYNTANNQAIFTIRIPDTATRSGGTDGHLNIIDPTRSTVVSMYNAVRRSDGDFDSWYPVSNDLRGDGLTGGRRAYGGSQIAGEIRRGELDAGIYHALSLTVEDQTFNKNPAPYVWPATEADNNWATIYGTTGTLHMGSLVAIPKSFNIDAQGWSARKKAIAKALQDYGAYLIDGGPNGNGAALNAEPTANSEMPADWDYGSGIFTNLQQITNNTETNVGGGGTPLACAAPGIEP